MNSLHRKYLQLRKRRRLLEECEEVLTRAFLRGDEVSNKLMRAIIYERVSTEVEEEIAFMKDLEEKERSIRNEH